MNILITGGAGFVGSYLAKMLKTDHPNWSITVLDNLKRRGSEKNLNVLKGLEVEFFHGDIRSPEDFDQLEKNYDLLIECSAEPSVHAGTNGNTPSYLINTNLVGSFNCLEFLRKKAGKMIFLSTSRVYSIKALQSLPLVEQATRFELETKDEVIGLSKEGISENFNTQQARSLYGASKLSSEMLIQEYAFHFNTQAIINRCGVIAGPGQWGKVDQGVYTLWVARHFFQKSLTYTGFGGEGKQVRDLLHVDDLYRLVLKQIESKSWDASIYNIGGGETSNTSLSEYTKICEEVTGKSLSIGSEKETKAVDIPYYVTDHRKATETFSWQPMKTPLDIVKDIHNWLDLNQAEVKDLF